ncbi:type 2 isopentenyl-diphosphate Delta-isomerase [Ectobacillus polymachus]|uniref:type 2 isopentenyl-diphosphate Delta-isomerase n=1 Tax=Ectobacillus polymachus TaxID=1508806 RepID=UPI003A84E05D
MTRAKRKIDHVQYALSTGQSGAQGFHDITFVHQSLPNMSLADVSLQTKIGELSLSSPIFINAMTGGGGEATERINGALAQAAYEKNIAMAVGSQMAALKDPSEERSFKIVREMNPTGIVFANLGSEATTEQAKRALAMLEGDAIQIHLNTIQELTMPEGDRDFTNALRRIERIVKEIEVPVIVKEVGFGMSKETVKQLTEIGVAIIDVGGFGGTNFATIENERRKRMLSYFNEWGIPTAVSLIEALSVKGEATFIASGGMQTALETIKALALGASAVAFAGHFLKAYMEHGMDGLIQEIDMIHDDLRYMMTALGCKTIKELQSTPLVISGHTFHWLTQRGIDTTVFSIRTRHS